MRGYSDHRENQWAEFQRDHHWRLTAMAPSPLTHHLDLAKAWTPLQPPLVWSPFQLSHPARTNHSKRAPGEAPIFLAGSSLCSFFVGRHLIATFDCHS